MNEHFESLNQRWNMDAIFAGGSSSPEFKQFVKQLAADTLEFRNTVHNDLLDWAKAVGEVQSISARLKEADSFIACMAAQDQSDKQAVAVGAELKGLSAQFESILAKFYRMLADLADQEWDRISNIKAMNEVIFVLKERRDWAREKMSPDLEGLANELAVDGYHGWAELYNTIVGRMTIPWEEDGQVHHLSMGQAANKLDDQDRAKRSAMFDLWENTWASQAELCADALNHIAGFRLKLYEQRGWQHVLKEPLAMNRLSSETLQTMWSTIERNKSVFVRYLERKAKLLGLKKLSWHDVDAPIGTSEAKLNYEEAASYICAQFHRISPKLSEFARKAFEEGWIEAEDRSGKRPGGFCTSFPISKETRIFMTYSGTPSNVSTLAHELGHAFHQYVMDDMPDLLQDYAMNVAETASTFAEMIVSDAALRDAANDEQRLVLLEDKIGRSIAFYMNIHARFLFETRFYEERKSGIVSVERLNQLMVEAQKEAFCDALDEYHPHFWASKLHFYLTDVPFYNFPYTFGYMFSAGIYAHALNQLDGFEDRYISLLRDTGAMTVEDLANKHLNVDLTKSDFWQKAIEMTAEDVEQFLKLTD